MEQIIAHVRTTGPVLAEGARLMVAGPGDPGMRVITIWDSNEARERFLSERLSEAYDQAGLSLDRAERDPSSRSPSWSPATSPAHHSRPER